MVRKLRELQNFARPTTKIDAEMQMSRWKAINETAKITKITKIAKITRIIKFCKANNENRREMQMSRRKSINKTAKITNITKIAKIARITKFCKANNENRRRNANESIEGHQRNKAVGKIVKFVNFVIFARP